MIDVNYHLLLEQGHPPPAHYFASFVKLAELGVVDAAFARRLAPAAGLRDRLVHQYEEVDPGKLFDALAPSRADIGEYVRAVEAYSTGTEGLLRGARSRRGCSTRPSIRFWGPTTLSSRISS